MTVAELIAILKTFPEDADVRATWEGITPEVTVYRAACGTVLLDSDHEHYRPAFETGTRTVWKGT